MTAVQHFFGFESKNIFRESNTLFATHVEIFEPLKNYFATKHNYFVKEHLIVLNDFVKKSPKCCVYFTLIFTTMFIFRRPSLGS